MRQTKMIRPEYAAAFKCIGPACEDSCCTGWAVPIDRPAFERYQALPESPLRVLLDANMVRTPEDANPAHYAKMRMPPTMVCPILTEEKLCRIHAELGEEFLCQTCATYPRIHSSIDNLEETALSLSCPEAARVVLLDEELARRTMAADHAMTWNENAEGAPIEYFWPIRELTVALVLDRQYALWQRIFLLGTLCRRLDAVKRGELRRNMAEVLLDFSSAVAEGGLRAAMERIPADTVLQLDMVLQLAGLCRDRTMVSARFVECLERFKRGIGFGAGAAQTNATLEALAGCYGEAHRRWFAPFFAANPHILENYLVNAIFRRQFPFGTKDGKVATEPETGREFALLATQFALIQGLLIGVAGCRREAFCHADVIHTVQAASKHFEHHPQFLDRVHELLVANGRDNPHGLTMLVRN